MQAGPSGRHEKAMYCTDPALGVGGVSAESPTGGAGLSARNRVDRRLKNKRWGGIEFCHAAATVTSKSMRRLYAAGFYGASADTRPAPVRTEVVSRH
jgi:hypothetical protein